MNLLQQHQYYSKYSRFNHELGRREHWPETVERTMDFLRELSGNKLSKADYVMLGDALLNMEASPSMRTLASAGPQARRQNISLYNCSYMPVDDLLAFSEALLISMSGTGLGFSVEKANVDKLPMVQTETGNVRVTHVVEDTTEGWQFAIRLGIRTWFDGDDIDFNYSLVRPKGSVLKTKGGQASGPEPLKNCLDTCKAIIRNRAGKKLRPIDAHDMMCVIGDCAVSGGSRRTAMISLFDLGDSEMMLAKYPGFWDHPLHKYRANANNSVVLTRSMSFDEIKAIMDTMFENKVGEPGIFSRQAAVATMPYRRDSNHVFGTNPCGEIVLRPNQFCNLSIAVAQPNDSLDDLRRKVRVAAIFGTITAMATHFPGLRDIWRKNTVEERLLGVDIMGHALVPMLSDAFVLSELRREVVGTNAEYAKLLGIEPSAATTCVKPGGNSSVLFGTSSGISPVWSEYYVRSVIESVDSPVFKILQAHGMPHESIGDGKVRIMHAVHCPDAITRHDVTAVGQCDYWKNVKLNYTEHNPSVTIYYSEGEKDALTEWVFNNQWCIGGMSFLESFDTSAYPWTPIAEISREEYQVLKAHTPNKIDWSLLSLLESEDQTTAAQELACVAGACELPVLT